LHFMPGAIERGADEVIHRRIHHQETLRAARFYILYARQEHAGITEQRPARIEDHVVAARAERRDYASDEGRGRLRRCILVADADAPAHIDVLEVNAFALQAVDQRNQALGRGDERRRILQQRADVATDAHQLHARHLQRLPIQPLRITVRHAELCLTQSGGDVRMCPGVDVRIDAEGDRRAAAERARDRVDARELRLGLDVDTTNAFFQRKADLRLALADARKQRLASLAACGEYARQLSARDDVEAGAEPREQREDREARVRLHRIADLRVAALQRLREFAVRAL